MQLIGGYDDIYSIYKRNGGCNTNINENGKNIKIECDEDIL